MKDSVGKRKRRPCSWPVTKNHSTKTDEELMRLREKYKDGVPIDIVYHLADKLAGALYEEGRCVGED